MNHRRHVTTRGTLAAVALISMLGCASYVPVGGGGGLPGVTQPAGAGTLALTVRGLEAYRALYAAADIASLKFTVRDANGGVVLTHTETSAHVRAQRGTIIFANIPAGDVTLLIEARGSAGSVIGSVTSGMVRVVAGETTAVSLELQLTDTPAPPTPTPAPMGAVTADVLIKDGQTLTNPSPTPTPTPTAGSYTSYAPIEINLFETGYEGVGWSGHQPPPLKLGQRLAIHNNLSRTTEVRVFRPGNPPTLLQGPYPVAAGYTGFVEFPAAGTYMVQSSLGNGGYAEIEVTVVE